MTKKKPNITPADVDTLYIDSSEKVYRLISCESEPHATMSLIADGDVLEKPISEFANFIRLKPERPIVKPATPRKPRSDKGIPRERKSKPEPVVTASEIAEALEPVTEKIKKRRKTQDVPEITDKKDDNLTIHPENWKGDNLTIHTPTGLGDDTEYKVNIAGSEATWPMNLGIRVIVLTALEEFGCKIPDSLSAFDRKTVQDILDAGK